MEKDRIENGRMKNQIISSVVQHLKSQRIAFEDGLSDEEVVRIESTFGFCFPPDLRDFLQTALPVSGGFPNWRSESINELRHRFLDRPWKGILFDLEHNDFWPKSGGSKPMQFDEIIAEAQRRFAEAPLLIPIRS